MRKFSRIRLLAGVLFFSTGVVVHAQYAGANSKSPVSFYVGAHQDDWALFENPNAYNDVQSAGAHVVFIYTTAGDAGCLGGPTKPSPYFLAREAGAARAVRFMAAVVLDSLNGPDADQGTWDKAEVAQHRITRYTYLNTVSYFLRLPDGGGEKCGPDTHGASLKGLETGAVRSLTAVDSSTTYFGWGDLVETLHQIVELERGMAKEVRINYQDPDTTLNTADHVDHTYTGMAMKFAADETPCARQVLYLDYVISTLPINLSTIEVIDKSGTFGNTVSGRVDGNWPGTWNSGHWAWIPRQYFTEIPGSSCRRSPWIFR